MTGTQSLSAAQLTTIHNEMNRLNGGTDPARWVEVEGRHIRVGTVVTVTVHQSLLHSDGRKRVHLHRVYTDSHVVGLLRDGTMIDSAQAA